MMVLPSLKEALLNELEKLGSADQLRVVDFARALASARPVGVRGSSLESFAGALPERKVDQMMAVIEEGCEKVDPGEW